MKTITIFAISFISFLSFSQTDIIEMRSRNASLKKFERNSKVNRVDHVASNFGMAPMPEVRNAVLDSVKVISDSVAIMYTSNYCNRGFYRGHNVPIQYELDQQQNGHNPQRTYSNPRVGHLWEPGADTVKNHPLFRHRHALDSVKAVIDRDYNFNLPSDSIEFIGFDNNQKQSTIKSTEKVKEKRQEENSIGWELLFMLLTPILFLYAMSRVAFPQSSNSE